MGKKQGILSVSALQSEIHMIIKGPFKVIIKLISQWIPKLRKRVLKNNFGFSLECCIFINRLNSPIQIKIQILHEPAGGRQYIS